MTWTELKPLLLPEFRQLNKRDFVLFCQGSDGRVRVGGSKGKGRITAKRALALLN